MTLSVEATGGNGVYTYVHRGVEQSSKFIDVEWARNTRLIGRIVVKSGDAQSLDKEYDFKPSEYCP